MTQGCVGPGFCRSGQTVSRRAYAKGANSTVCRGRLGAARLLVRSGSVLGAELFRLMRFLAVRVRLESPDAAISQFVISRSAPESARRLQSFQTLTRLPHEAESRWEAYGKPRERFRRPRCARARERKASIPRPLRSVSGTRRSRWRSTPTATWRRRSSARLRGASTSCSRTGRGGEG